MYRQVRQRQAEAWSHKKRLEGSSVKHGQRPSSPTGCVWGKHVLLPVAIHPPPSCNTVEGILSPEMGHGSFFSHPSREEKREAGRQEKGLKGAGCEGVEGRKQLARLPPCCMGVSIGRQREGFRKRGIHAPAEVSHMQPMQARPCMLSRENNRGQPGREGEAAGHHAEMGSSEVPTYHTTSTAHDCHTARCARQTCNHARMGCPAHAIR